jgi:tRNA(fMet)-specific endonuclease VapC
VEVKILIDTSAYVGFKRNVTDIVNIIVNAEVIIFSPIVQGELMFGFRAGSRFKKNMADLNLFLDNDAVELIRIGETTSDRYSRIAALLRQQGTPIPTNDIWIAAQAMESGAELITTDRHFDKIPGLVYSRI